MLIAFVSASAMTKYAVVSNLLRQVLVVGLEDELVGFAASATRRPARMARATATTRPAARTTSASAMSSSS
ncbi:MAG: hypothetical protein AVDCRST_MAG53-1630 [uncultured Solirubrobacteraceae bacterium]|uniref:Uncharacterized protein n=1 Tax=uncultured Solirubrobacteraceae bacterium TaxID=1162706 RepID=A0A6J4SG68_9ACTN|nr:MAG: hypothetical protein AVDCRST_MAG53-1630 [uncultured Solirubrobacteraceae bacterium]